MNNNKPAVNFLASIKMKLEQLTEGIMMMEYLISDEKFMIKLSHKQKQINTTLDFPVTATVAQFIVAMQAIVLHLDYVDGPQLNFKYT